MREIIKWVSEARPDKDVGVAMTHYHVARGEIRATNGKITAGHPWPTEDEFLVSGIEFEKVLARMDGASDDPVVSLGDEPNTVVVRSGRFHATIATLPVDSWAYPGVDDATWLAVPADLIEVLRALRAFVPDNPAQAWQGAVALDHGNCYATNNIAIAGRACAVGDVKALLPAYAIDFLLRRTDGVESWSHSPNYVAFKWDSGAWMRSQLLEGQFHERAAAMVREAYDIEPTQEITDEFREAFADVAALAEDTVHVFADRIESRFKKSLIVAACKCEVPPEQEITVINDKGRSIKKTTPGGVSIWSAAALTPVIAQATHWSPGLWPKPAPFRGDNVAGYIVGRKD